MTTIAVNDPDRIYLEDLIARVIEGRKHRDGGQWEMGDAALEIETSYGAADLERAAERAEVDYDTLRDYRRVAAAYENGARATNLSWRHHRDIASREDRVDWLTLASENRWSVRAMLAAIEDEEQRAAEEEEHRKQLERLAKQNKALAERVANGEIEIAEALAESALVEKQAEKDRAAKEVLARRVSGELARLCAFAETLAFSEGRSSLIDQFDNGLSAHSFKVTKNSLENTAHYLSLLAEEWR